MGKQYYNVMKNRFSFASNLFKVFLLFVLSIVTSFSLKAESIVYVIGHEFGGGEPTLTLSIDGQNIGSIAGSIKKTIKPSGSILIPFVQLRATIKKCVFNTDGKVAFRIDASSTNITNPSSVAKYYGEVQLDLEDGKTYYIQIKPKGLTNVQLVEIAEKKGVKELNNTKKYEILEEWIQSE